MDLHHLRVFQAAARTGSFTAAGRDLLLSQSTVSLHIKQLEEEFGCALFLRTKKRVYLSDAGRVLQQYAERTLALVSELHAKYGSVRSVIQAYLYRSEGDIENLCRQSIPVRLCKGAYRESADVAFRRKKDVDANYVRLMLQLFDHGAYPAIATHDESIVKRALGYIRERNIAADRFEFQMLYGVGRELQRRLVASGFRLRLYVPYGNAWYPYFMRRLAERPANVLFLARNLLKN